MSKGKSNNQISNFANAIGKRISSARRHLKVTQKDLAGVLDISQPNLYYIESGRHLPSEETVEKIANALGIASAWIYGQTHEGGVSYEEQADPKLEEKEKLSARWIDVYARLKSLGIITSDTDFAEKYGMGKPALSLVLNGKSTAPISWIPMLEQLGGNREYIYNDRLPLVILGKNNSTSNLEDVHRNIKALLKNIEEDTKQLNFFLNQIL